MSRDIRRVAADADVEVRMDSKLVVEQMSGNWKIKHADLRPLALRANALATSRSGSTTYTWVPREQNKHADRLANEALDGTRSGATFPSEEPAPADSAIEEAESPEARDEPDQGWGPARGPVTTLVLVRHGATSHTAGKRFSGGLASSNPGLTDDGRAQVREVADW